MSLAVQIICTLPAASSNSISAPRLADSARYPPIVGILLVVTSYIRELKCNVARQGLASENMAVRSTSNYESMIIVDMKHIGTCNQSAISPYPLNFLTRQARIFPIMIFPILLLVIFLGTALAPDPAQPESVEVKPACVANPGCTCYERYHNPDEVSEAIQHAMHASETKDLVTVFNQPAANGYPKYFSDFEVRTPECTTTTTS